MFASSFFFDGSSVLLESLVPVLLKTRDGSELQALWYIYYLCTRCPGSVVYRLCTHVLRGREETVPCPQLDGAGTMGAVQAAVGFVICMLSTIWLRFIFVRPLGHLHSQKSGQ